MGSRVEALLSRMIEELREIKDELRLLRQIIIPEEEISDEEKKELLRILMSIEKGEYVRWRELRKELVNEQV